MAKITHVDGAKIHFKKLFPNAQLIHIEKDNNHAEIMMFVSSFAEKHMHIIAVLNDDASWSYLLRTKHTLWPSFTWTTSHETILRTAGFLKIFSGHPEIQSSQLTMSFFNFKEMSDGAAIRQYASLRTILRSFIFGKEVVDLILQYYKAPWENRSRLHVCEITKKNESCVIL